MRDFLTTLLECSVSMSAVALVLMALTPLLSKRYAAKWIYSAWLIIVIGLIVPFRFHFPAEFLRTDTVVPAVRQALSPDVGNAAAAAVQTVAANGGSPTVPWVPILFTLWLTGAAAFLVVHGFQHARFLKMVGRWGEPAGDPKTLAALEHAKVEMGIAKRVRLLICPCISSPMMIGFRAPAILLPQSPIPEDALPYILRHELVHFKRKDLWFKSLVILATSIHWFNPVLYLAARAIALQCEISCDAQVVSGTDAAGRQRYGEAILEAIRRRPRMQTAFSTNFYSGRAGMKKRIFSILDTRKKKAGIVLLCLILLGTAGTGAAFAADRQKSPDSSRQSIGGSAAGNSVQTIAEQWAEAVKKRDGKAQYALMSPKCQAAVYDEYSSSHWSTGVSSPWVESYAVSANQTGATVTYRYATSTGFAGTYKQTLSFVNRNGRFCIDAFTEPKEVPQSNFQTSSENGSADADVRAFLDSADGRSFQQTANRFVKAYLIGDVREMKRNLSDPKNGQNDFSMNGRTVNWKSLTLKLDPKGIGGNAVSADYEIALTAGGVQLLSFQAEKVEGSWKIDSYRIKK